MKISKGVLTIFALAGLTCAAQAESGAFLGLEAGIMSSKFKVNGAKG